MGGGGGGGAAPARRPHKKIMGGGGGGGGGGVINTSLCYAVYSAVRSYLCMCVHTHYVRTWECI